MSLSTTFIETIWSVFKRPGVRQMTQTKALNTHYVNSLTYKSFQLILKQVQLDSKLMSYSTSPNSGQKRSIQKIIKFLRNTKKGRSETKDVNKNLINDCTARVKFTLALHNHPAPAQEYRPGTTPISFPKIQPWRNATHNETENPIEQTAHVRKSNTIVK